MVTVEYGEPNTLGFRPFIRVKPEGETTPGNTLWWIFPDEMTEFPAFVPDEIGDLTGGVTGLLNWATRQENMTWVAKPHLPGAVVQWPLIGPPNAKAQADADAKYHGKHVAELQSLLEEEPLSLEAIAAKGVRFDLFDQQLNQVYADAYALCLRKHHDYGPLNIALAPGGPINGLRVRMHDKLARINHLVESGTTPTNESLRDSFMDLLNYAAISMMVLDGNWPGVLED